MLSLILGFLSGPLSQISNDLTKAYQAKLSAQNDQERLVLDGQIAVLEARKSTILAAQSSPVERWIRFGFAFPFVVYINKLVLWDKVLHLGATDALSSDLNQLLWIVVGGYFVDTTIRGTARIMKK